MPKARKLSAEEERLHEEHFNLMLEISYKTLDITTLQREVAAHADRLLAVDLELESIDARNNGSMN